MQFSNIVYTLSDPSTGDVRYVGCTNRQRSRLLQHIFEARKEKSQSRKDLWIRSLLDNGLAPRMDTIEIVQDYLLLGEREKFWIQAYLSLGHDLTNGRHKGVCGIGKRSMVAKTRMILVHTIRNRPFLMERIAAMYDNARIRELTTEQLRAIFNIPSTPTSRAPDLSKVHKKRKPI